MADARCGNCGNRLTLPSARCAICGASQPAAAAATGRRATQDLSLPSRLDRHNREMDARRLRATLLRGLGAGVVLGFGVGYLAAYRRSPPAPVSAPAAVRGAAPTTRPSVPASPPTPGRETTADGTVAITPSPQGLSMPPVAGPEMKSPDDAARARLRGILDDIRRQGTYFQVSLEDAAVEPAVYEGRRIALAGEIAFAEIKGGDAHFTLMSGFGNGAGIGVDFGGLSAVDREDVLRSGWPPHIVVVTGTLMPGARGTIGQTSHHLRAEGFENAGAAPPGMATVDEILNGD